MKQKLLKIGSVLVDVLIIVAFIASIFVVVANITARNNNSTPNIFGFTLDSVQTNSMSGTFEVGALVIGKIPAKDTVLEKGQIITFYDRINGVQVTKTHRISDVDTSGPNAVYQTWGDNREVCPVPDANDKTIYDVASVYQFHIPLVGGFIDFLKKPVGFIVCMVIPMLAFIGWQVYKLIDIYLQSKKQEMLETAAAVSAENVSDEAKDAIIREYLAKMQAQSGTNTENSENSENTENKE